MPHTLRFACTDQSIQAERIVFRFISGRLFSHYHIHALEKLCGLTVQAGFTGKPERVWDALCVPRDGAVRYDFSARTISIVPVIISLINTCLIYRRVYATPVRIIHLTYLGRRPDECETKEIGFPECVFVRENRCLVKPHL